MKLTSVEIRPENSSDYAVLSFRDPRRENPYNVKAIFGLDVDEITPKFYKGSGSTNFYSQSLEKRDIVVRVELNPTFSDSETYSDLRDALYKMIASSRTGKVQLRFKNGVDTIAAISGFVSKFEAPHFEKNPEVQITINCVEPMLKALTPLAVSVAGLNPSNTTITDDLSTAPHGFTFDMNVTAIAASTKITDPDEPTVWSFEVTPVGGFLVGDILHLSSEYNQKELYIQRGAAKIYLASVITPGSVWPIIFPGENKFSFTNPTKFSWNAISYYPTYWGV